jgi:SAM-dependent methyltransferase
MSSPDRLKIIARPRCPDWLPRDGQIIERIGSHQALYRFHKPLYQLELLKDLAALVPSGDCRILDVGAGSGLIAEMIATMFPGKTVAAVDVIDRILPTVGVPFRTFDGQVLPFEDDSFDCVLLSNVLHHVNPNQRRGLLNEALRVTGGGPLVIKDHLAESRLDRFKLTWLDFAGNAPFGGMVDAWYLDRSDWDGLFADLECTGEMLIGSPYRGGMYGVMFPNRLEICLRVNHAR